MNILVDTDVLLARISPVDSNHTLAKQYFEQLNRNHDNHLYLLSSTLAEFATITSIKLGLNEAQKAVSVFVDAFTIIELNADEVIEASSLFKKQTSKNNSLFDCYNMIAAKKHKAQYILSFDNGYLQNGYTLFEISTTNNDIN